jgi:hypothetical protein
VHLRQADGGDVVSGAAGPGYMIDEEERAKAKGNDVMCCLCSGLLAPTYHVVVGDQRSHAVNKTIDQDQFHFMPSYLADLYAGIIAWI